MTFLSYKYQQTALWLMSILLNFCTPYYDNQYKLIYSSSLAPTKETIKYPYCMYGSSNWNSTFSPELWNKGNTLYTLNNNPIYKTIYDPTTQQYAIPKPTSYTNFTLNGVNKAEINTTIAFKNGYFLYTMGWHTGKTIFFPAFGGRYQSGISNFNQVLLWPTSGPANSSSSHIIWAVSGRFYVDCSDGDCYYSFGMPIMPALESNN